jgi:hypothetical protein
MVDAGLDGIAVKNLHWKKRIYGNYIKGNFY